MVCTRPDIAQAVSCQQIHEQSRAGVLKSSQVDLKISERKSYMALCYEGTGVRLHKYVVAGDVDSRMSTTGYIFTLRSRAIS